MADHLHKHRDLWVALAIGLLAIGATVALGIWSTESAKQHVGFWPHAVEVGGLVMIMLGIVLIAALLLGWPLPGGFAEGVPAQSAAPAPTESTAAASAEERKDRLLPGERLSAGESLYSPDGTVRLDMQRDGNLVVYCPEQILPVLWPSDTAQTGDANYLEFQDNGNLLLCTSEGRVLIDWQAADMGGKCLVLQDKAIWSSTRTWAGSFGLRTERRTAY